MCAASHKSGKPCNCLFIRRLLVLAGLLMTLISWFSYSPAVHGGELSLELTTITVQENASSFDIQVFRNGTVNETASVTVKTESGTATVADDFINISSALSWASGDISPRTITVSIIDDKLIEDDETFTIELINVQGDTLATNKKLTVTIADYENGRIGFSSTKYTTSEDQLSIALTLVRNHGSDGLVSARYTLTENTASKESDYVDSSDTIEFADGDTEQTLFLSLKNDDIAEILETFTVTLSDFAGGVIAGEIITSEVTILDTDLDFTPALVQIDSSSDHVRRPLSIDLSQLSIEDDDISFLELLNNSPVLSSTDLELTQAKTGIASILAGNTRASLRPIAVTRLQDNSSPAIVLHQNGAGYFVTEQNVKVEFHPAIADLTVLTSVLDELGMSEVVINDHGNLEVQKDQGSPPLEVDSDGQVYISNTYYDRFHFRPSIQSTEYLNGNKGISSRDDQDVAEVFTLLINYELDSSTWQQPLFATPIDSAELITSLRDELGVKNIETINYSEIAFDQSGSPYHFLADVTISRIENFDDKATGLFPLGDIDGNGLIDYQMNFSNGDSQTFFLLRGR